MQIKYKYNNNWQTLSLTSLGMGTIGAKNTLTPADIPNLNDLYFSLTNRTAIPENADLNTITYMTPGSYYATTSISRTLTNCPVTDTAFYMEVGKTTGTSYPYQKITVYKTGTIYYRATTNSSADWNQWYKIVLSAEQTNENRFLATPNGTPGHASFRSIVADDIPSLAISKITGLQSALNDKSDTSHKHAAEDITSGTLGVARGGTGRATLTSGSYLVGAGTSQVTLKTPAQVLSDIGAAASSHEHAAGDITSGSFGVARGGTGRSTLTSGSYLVGNGTSNVSLKTPSEVLSDIGAAASSHTHQYLYTSDDLHRTYISTNNNIVIQSRSTTSDSYTTAGYAAVSSVAPTASAQQAANKVFATPNGSNGYPSMRALVADDLPSHSHSANDITSDTLNIARIPVITAAKGGSGETSLSNSANAYINALGTGTDTPQDNDYFISQYVGGGTTNTTYRRRPISALWTYIQSKTDSRYFTLTGRTSISENADLNADTYKTIGSYYATSNVASTLSNCPSTNAAFHMEVGRALSTTYPYQRIVNYLSGVEYYRTVNSDSTWGTWYKSSQRSTETTTANRFLATPNGSNGYATYRSIVADDIPTLSVSKIENAVAANASTETATLTGDEYVFVTKVSGDSTTWRRRTLKNAIFPYIKSAWALGQTEATITAAKGTTASNSFGYAGTRVTGVSVTNSSANNIFSVALQPGVWVVSYGATFSSNATGRRAIFLGTSTTAVTQNSYGAAVTQAFTGSGINTTVKGNTLIDISSAKTYYINVWQNSGSALSDCEVWVGAVKVA